MSFRFQENAYYRMPAHFGPSPSPRQGPNGETFDWSQTPIRKAISLSFLSDAAALEALMPPELELVGDPVVTIDIVYMSELEWLAGRGYNTFGVKWPARFTGKNDDVVGSFLSILWENMPDPILSGRDELGFSKLFCEIPTPRVHKGSRIYDTSWMGHHFFRLEAKEFEEVGVDQLTAAQSDIRNDGLLHYKYVPKTGSPGKSSISEITFTPSTGGQTVVDRVWRGTGIHEFMPSVWEDLPTMSHIVEAFRGLPIHEYRDAWMIESHGGKDLGDQRVLS